MADPIAVSPLLIVSLQVGGTLIGAGVGAFTAWWIASRKLKYERAFDRQLEWHESMYRTLDTAAVAITRALHAFANSEVSQEGITQLGTATLEALEPIRRVRADAFLFADPNVVMQVNALWDAHEAELVQFSGRIQAAAEQPNGLSAVSLDFARVTEQLATMLVQTMREVGASHRKHLSLAKLPDGAFKKSGVEVSEQRHAQSWGIGGVANPLAVSQRANSYRSPKP